MAKKRKELTDKQAERKFRLIALPVGILAFAFGVYLKMLAKDHVVSWPELSTTLLELIAWPFWIGGFWLTLVGLGMKTGSEK